MNKTEILAEEARQGKRLLDLRREFNARLSGGAKQLVVTRRRETVKESVSPVTKLQDLKTELKVDSNKEIWTHNNLLVADERPALGPWISVPQLLRLSKPQIQIV